MHEAKNLNSQYIGMWEATGMVGALVQLNTGLTRIRSVKSNVQITDMGKLTNNIGQLQTRLGKPF